MSKSSRTALERGQSNGSIDSDFIPSDLRTSPGSALSVTPSERKRYNSAYIKAKTSRKKKHIARHLRRKTARRAERKRKVIESRRALDSPIIDPPRWLYAANTARTTLKKSPDEYTKFKQKQIAQHMLLSTQEKMKAASDRRTDRGKNIAHFMDHKYGVFDKRK
jgi:hypothetical protein